jgi:hypothetical protein
MGTAVMRIVQHIFRQVRHIWVLGLLLGFGFATGLVQIPGVSAQQAPECDGECVFEESEETDLCSNLEGFQYELPEGYVVSDSQNNICIDKSPSTQVLGATSNPQVLGMTDSFGK